jgi:putative nucleotidyltransferase with HDIG domain
MSKLTREDDSLQPPQVSINDLIEELVVGQMNTRMYWNDHPRVQASISELSNLLPALLDHHDRTALDIHVAGDHIVFDRRPLMGVSIAAIRLIEALRERRAGGLRIERGVSDDDYRNLFQFLTDRPDETATLEHHNAEFVRKDCRGIQLLEPTHLVEEDDAPTKGQRISISVHQRMVHTLQETTISMSRGGMIHFDQSRACISSVLDRLNDGKVGSMLSATRYERYDAYTFGHSVRVAVLALTFARTLTDNPDLLNRIGVAALLHDVGKVRVPFEILHCKTRLDAEQQREMQKHAEYGAEILLDHDNCDPMAYAAAFGHHMSESGKGYPNLLHRPSVSLVTRIIKICDVFEALTAVRPYKASMSSLRAFRIMMGMEDSFDRVMLKRFIKAIGVYPAGAQVKLSTGEAGIVIEQSSDLFRPVIEIDTTQEGELISEGDRTELDLSRALEQGSGCASCVVERVLENAEFAPSI